MSSKTKSALIALSVILIILLGTSVFCYNAELYTKNGQVNDLTEQIAIVKDENERLDNTINHLNDQLSQKNNQLNILSVQLNNLTQQVSTLSTQVFNQSASSPANITVASLTVEDNRSVNQYYIRVYGRVNNTGTSTAYNAGLHVVARNQEGTAVDIFYSFGGLSGHMSVGLNFKINYTGSAIKSWTIFPEWTDKMISSSGTFP